MKHFSQIPTKVLMSVGCLSDLVCTSVKMHEITEDKIKMTSNGDYFALFKSIIIGIINGIHTM